MKNKNNNKASISSQKILNGVIIVVFTYLATLYSNLDLN